MPRILKPKQNTSVNSTVHALFFMKDTPRKWYTADQLIPLIKKKDGIEFTHISLLHNLSAASGVGRRSEHRNVFHTKKVKGVRMFRYNIRGTYDLSGTKDNSTHKVTSYAVRSKGFGVKTLRQVTSE